MTVSYRSAFSIVVFHAILHYRHTLYRAIHFLQIFAAAISQWLVVSLLAGEAFIAASASLSLPFPPFVDIARFAAFAVFPVRAIFSCYAIYIFHSLFDSLPRGLHISWSSFRYYFFCHWYCWLSLPSPHSLSPPICNFIASLPHYFSILPQYQS